MNQNSRREEEQLAWEEVSCEHLVQDEWIDFRRSEYRFPDGRTFAPYYSYSRRDFIVIMARDTEGNYITVRQYRQGLETVTNEFVAGGIERTDGKEYGGKDNREDALLAAKRELFEETGYESEEWTYLMTVPSNPTIADNYAVLFMADNCRKKGSQHLDETEFLHVHTYTEEELRKLIEEGDFQQPIHILAWYLAKERMQKSAE